MTDYFVAIIFGFVVVIYVMQIVTNVRLRRIMNRMGMD